MIFIRVCQYIINYIVGYEIWLIFLGEDWIVYFDQYIEVDNCLSWMFGKLGKKYGKDVFYVYFKWDVEVMVVSFNWRWGRVWSIIDVYIEGIFMCFRECGLEFCVDYVDIVYQNVGYFLRDKFNCIQVDLEEAKIGFWWFWNVIGVEGDLEAVFVEWDI